MIVDGAEVPLEPATVGDDVTTKKRHKTLDGTSVSTNSGSAASFEDDRQIQ
jgi:hypothetical protein